MRDERLVLHFCTVTFNTHQTEENRINLVYNKPTRSVQVTLHVGWVIYYSNLLGTSFDIHEMIARSSLFLPPVSHPFYLSCS